MVFWHVVCVCAIFFGATQEQFRCSRDEEYDSKDKPTDERSVTMNSKQIMAHMQLLRYVE